jgi:hypothetical protein
MMGCIGECLKRYGLLDSWWATLNLFYLSPILAFVSSKKHFSGCLPVSESVRQRRLEKLGEKCARKACHTASTLPHRSTT